MSYQKINEIMNQLKEELILAGFVELIAPYFFLNVQPRNEGVANIQKLDQFAFLITLNEEVLQVVSQETIRNMLIQQMLHACRGAQEETLRWRLLIHQVNDALHTSIPDREYEKKELMSQAEKKQTNADFSDGYLLAQACRACGFKNMKPYGGQVFVHQVICPMCDQDTCAQAV